MFPRSPDQATPRRGAEGPSSESSGLEPQAGLSLAPGILGRAPPSRSEGSALAGGFASCEGWQSPGWRPAPKARTPKGQGQAAGLHREERSWAWGNRISSPPGRSRSGPGRTRPPLWRARLLGRPKSANNSAMLPPARPGSSGYTAAAEGQETGWRFFIVTNIKSGLSPLSLAPYPNADRKQINL